MEQKQTKQKNKIMDKNNETGFSLAEMLREELKSKYPITDGMKEEITDKLRNEGIAVLDVDNFEMAKFAIIDWARDNGLSAYDVSGEIHIRIPS